MEVDETYIGGIERNKHRSKQLDAGGGLAGKAAVNVESFWAELKRGTKGIYHHLSKKHRHRYAKEFATRRKIRFYDTIDRMKYVVKHMQGKRLTYKDLTA